MRFLFVDVIDALDQSVVRGRRRFASTDPWRRDSEVAPGVLSEAIGQLASWLCLARNDFTARPVFLFADRIELLRPVTAGSEVELSATVADMDASTFTFSGEARLGDQVVHRITNCSGYFMPLADLEDPQETRRRFAALTGGGLTLPGAHGDSGMAPFDFSSLLGEVSELKPGQMIRASSGFAADTPFYADHFPRFPVTPIVVLNEMIAAAATHAFGGRLAAVRDIKIKSFVRPGERCETSVRLERRLNDRVHTIAEIIKDGKRILRGAYEIDLVPAAAMVGNGVKMETGT